MAIVIFSGELEKLTGDTRIEISSVVYRDMVTELVARYSALSRELLEEMAVAIDGVIIVDPLLEKLPEDSEIHFLHFVAGG
ncbi:MAG: MoaD/ThiS family protein [Pseudomonadales bacterium]|mgnify:CR=1 FL=1|jgi:molybdopterin converting factor small subunit|nr:MoaD/ThiS family protein [Pseudomonadales bacterium]MDG1444702.1 MoaD/ThiS family protein [Pseudomonadales bacterium]